MCFGVRWSGGRVLSVFAVALAVLAPTTGQAQAQTFTLRVFGFVDGTGKVTSNPAGISCTTAKYNPVGPCSATFAAGTVVTLTAVPGEQNTFGGWSGGGCTGTGDCQVTVDQDNIEVRPNFIATRYQVTIVGAGNGTGTLHEPLGGAFGDPPIICTIRNGEAVDSRCTTTVAYNSVVQLEFETNVAGTNLLRAYSSACSIQPPGPCNAVIRFGTTITATIVANELRVRSAGGNGTGTVTSTGGNAQINCTITGAAATGVCGKIYTSDTPGLVTLVATPGEGSRFVGWSGACTSDPCTLFPDFPPNVPEALARFELLPEQTFKLAVSGNGGSGRGHVTSSPSGIDCDFSVPGKLSLSGTGTCQANFPFGTTVVLTATPRDGTKVLGFTGDCASQATTCTVIMYHDRSTTVQLDPAKFPVTVTATGNGSGSVWDFPNLDVGLIDAIRCRVTRGVVDGQCTVMYPFGSSLRLSLIPMGSSKATADQTTCVTSACTVTGPFTLNTTFTAPEINIVGAGNGTGRVVDTGVTGLNCTITPGGLSGSCSIVFDMNVAKTANFNPIPDFGSVFAGYSGLCTGIQACSTSGDFPPNTQLVARFELQAPTEFPITVTMAGTGSGTVRSTPAGIVCTRLDGNFSGNCATSFATGTNLTLTPEPAAGSRFVEWGGDCTGAGSCTVTMDQVHNVSARFEPASASPIALMVAGVGTGRGIVAVAPGSTQCTFTGVVAGDACSVSYAQSTQVTLTASPQFGSTFGGWGGDACTGTALTCTFTISAATTVSVNFISPHSVLDLALALTGGFTLTPNEREGFDRLGNRNGGYDLGDLLAYLDRTGQKLTSTDAAAAMAARPAPTAVRTTRRAP